MLVRYEVGRSRLHAEPLVELLRVPQRRGLVGFDQGDGLLTAQASVANLTTGMVGYFREACL